jgi:uncharacterized membrane protein YdcZ (DUF606 family)
MSHCQARIAAAIQCTVLMQASRLLRYPRNDTMGSKNETSAVAGIREMFRYTGGMIGAAVVTLVLSLVTDQALAMRGVFVVFGLFLLLLIPIVFMIPDLVVKERKDDGSQIP